MKTVDDLCALISARIALSGRASGVAECCLVIEETPLLESGMLDSIAVVQIVAEVQRQFHVDFPEYGIVAGNFRTPLHLWRFVSTLPVHAEREA